MHGPRNSQSLSPSLSLFPALNVIARETFSYMNIASIIEINKNSVLYKLLNKIMLKKEQKRNEERQKKERLEVRSGRHAYNVAAKCTHTTRPSDRKFNALVHSEMQKQQKRTVFKVRFHKKIYDRTQTITLAHTYTHIGVRGRKTAHDIYAELKSQTIKTINTGRKYECKKNLQLRESNDGHSAHKNRRAKYSNWREEIERRRNWKQKICIYKSIKAAESVSIEMSERSKIKKQLLLSRRRLSEIIFGLVFRLIVSIWRRKTWNCINFINKTILDIYISMSS